MKQWNIKNFDQIVKLRNQGLNWQEIGEYYAEAGPTGPRGFYYRQKPKSRNQYDPISEEKKLKISQLKHLGMSYSEIASKLNTTKNAIAGACWRWKL
jgi:hypothetical protein